jgi:hypothetical protein
MATNESDFNLNEHPQQRLQIGIVQCRYKTTQGQALGFRKNINPPIVRAAETSGGRSTHFVAEGEHGKGQCHHKRHGKDYHVHIAIISHIGHLQQYCYIYATLLWPILNDTAGDVPGNYVIATI